MHPVGPRSSGEYWVRRALVAVVAVIAVVGLVWWVVGRGSASPDAGKAAVDVTTTPLLTGVLETSSADTGLSDSADSAAGDSSGESAGGDSAGESAADTGVTDTGVTGAGVTSTGPVTITVTESAQPETTAANTGSTAADETKASSTETSTTKTTSTKTTSTKTTSTKAAAPTTKPTAPKTTPPPEPSYDSAGRLICADASITVRAITQSATFPVGSQPRLGMAVTNTGSKDCVRDLSGTLQTYTVYTAAGDRVWSTADCFPGEGHEVRALAPGATANFIIKWSGTTSEPGCAAPRTPVKAGKYVLVAKLGTIKSAKLAFTMR